MQIDSAQINRYINIGDLDAQDLMVPENFESIKYAAYNIIDEFQRDRALIFANKLELLVKGLDSSDKQEAYVKRIFTYWVLRLKIFAFGKLKLQEKISLLKEHMVKAASFGLEVKPQIIDYLNSYYSKNFVDEATRNYILAINGSQEILGTDPSLPQAGFKPTLGNWLREYQATLQASNEDKGGAGTFHILKFLDTNPQVKFLKAEEKEILKSLLDFYNWLLNPVFYVTEIKDESPVSYINRQKFILPPEEVRPLVSVPQQPAVIPQVKPPTVALPKFSSPSSGLNLQGGAGGVNLKPPLPPISGKPAGLDIDKKLQDLKKRTEKNSQ